MLLKRNAVAVYQHLVDSRGFAEAYNSDKRFVAKALAHQAVCQGYDVPYLEADARFARYAQAGAAERAELLKGWVEPDLQVLDDLFLARRISPEPS